MQALNSTRRNILGAIPFIGAALVAPAAVASLPTVVGADEIRDAQAEIQRHIEALKVLAGDDIVVLVAGNPTPPRKTFDEMMRPATDEEREWWKQEYPSDLSYLTTSGVIVQIEHETKHQAEAAGRSAACVWLVADGYEPTLMTSDQLHWNIVGRVL